MCESRSLPGFPFNIFIELAADMAQLVERTLGKGEVPSSILGISTSGQNLFNSLNYQRFSLNFNSSKFFKIFVNLAHLSHSTIFSFLKKSLILKTTLKIMIFYQKKSRIFYLMLSVIYQLSAFFIKSSSIQN